MSNNFIIEGGIQKKEKRSELKEIHVDVDRWEIFYIDERNGEKWIEEYPHPEQQAGGASQLRMIDKFPWED
jgi:hypothetical protein